MNELKINYKDKSCIQRLSEYLYNLILNSNKDYNKIIILCIGTDRSTGDSLGPITGYMLSHRKELKDKCEIIGTLHEPIHAQNLEETIQEIDTKNNLIIAVDACLGELKNIGNIYIENDSLNPGAGVNKDLPSIGDISIKGIINVSGALEFMVLQNTRLSIVYDIAAEIDEIISEAINKLYENRFLEAL